MAEPEWVLTVQALRRPHGGWRIRILSAITNPAVAARLVGCVEMPTRGPPLGLARYPSKDGLEDEASELA